MGLALNVFDTFTLLQIRAARLKSTILAEIKKIYCYTEQQWAKKNV